MDIDTAVFNVLRTVSGTRWGDRVLDAVLSPFNLFSSQRYSNPYPLYHNVRSINPAYWHRRLRLWVITGYDEAIEVLRGPVSVDRSEMVTGLSPYRDMSQANANLMLSNMLMQDPPDHTRLRRMVNRGFTPRSVKVMEERIMASAVAVVEELEAAGAKQPIIDVVAATRDLPIRMICDLLGVPPERRLQMVAIADTLSTFADPITGFQPEVMDQAVDDLSLIVTELAAARAVNPTSDLISTLVTPDADGNVLDGSELISMVALLLIAGQETTSGLIGNSIIALSNFPGERSKLLEGCDHDRAVEELLRFDSPIQATDRTMLADLQLSDGQRLRRGQIAVICLGAANRDPRRYERADELVLDRDEPRSLSFGHGPHHCLGAALARIQAKSVLSAFVHAFPEYRVDNSTISWKRSTTLRGPSHLSVQLNR